MPGRRGVPRRPRPAFRSSCRSTTRPPGWRAFTSGLPRWRARLRQQRGLAAEVIYVDDGSRDDSFAVARALPAEALDVQALSLSRNFGKEAALMAGLDHARLGATLFIDGDGQHPPDLIDKLVSHWLDDGYDVIYTAKAQPRAASRCCAAPACARSTN